jgi:hypothetical protein
MKVTTCMFLGTALYTVLLCTPPMLSADGGDTTHPAKQTPRPMHLAGAASAAEPMLRLTNDQLDSVVAGHVGDLQIPSTITIPTLGTFVLLQTQPQTFILIPAAGNAEATAAIQIGYDQISLVAALNGASASIHIP